MNIKCPRPGCTSHSVQDPRSRPIVRNGFFRRSSDSRRIRRYFCRCCHLYFSNATQRPDRYQKKRRLNYSVFQLYCSGVSQRRMARIFGVSRQTIVRKIRFLASEERKRQRAFLKEHCKASPLSELQFDDLETSEHTKCKPLSVTLAVDPLSRKILKFRVSRMPAKGHLAEISRRKYGPRMDERPREWSQFFEKLKPYVQSECTWSSDENPHYPAHLKRHHPKAKHIRHPGARGCVSGQGELKKLQFDPLFSLNHTCAMLRANMNRLFRRSWCLSKTKRGLIDHLSLYVAYHNRFLTRPLRS